MSNFETRIREQLDNLGDKLRSFFDAEYTNDVNFFVNDACDESIIADCIIGAEITYGDPLSQYSIYSFTHNGDVLYVKFYGTYYSYGGSCYNGWEFVRPVEKTIIEYEYVG